MTYTVLDVETHLIVPGNLAPRLVCGSVASDTIAPTVLLRDGILAEARRILLSNEHVGGSNLAFDFGVLCAEDPTLLPLVFEKYERGEVHDTHVREALHDIARGCLFKDPGTSAPIGRYSVELLARRYLGLDLSQEKNDPNSWRLRYAELDGVPLDRWPEEAIAYSKGDAEHELAILKAQDGHRNLHDEPNQVRAAWCLHLMSMWGMRTDPEAVNRLATDVELKHAEAQTKFFAAKIYKQGGTKKAPKLVRDTKFLGELVTEAYGGSPPLTELGAVKTDRDTLKESGSSLLIEFAEVGENEKLFTTYLDVVREGTVRPINARFNVLVATGRTSCEKPNLQNLPRKGRVREAFVPRDGRTFIFCDYSTLELRALAQVNINLQGWSRMAEVLREGLDLHTQLAARLVGTAYEDLDARVKAEEKLAEDYRQMSKAAGFGLPGGLGAEKLVAYARMSYGVRFCVFAGRADTCGLEMRTARNGKPICGLCVDVAKEVKAQWLETWPEMAGFFQYISGLTGDPLGGEIEQPWSKRIRGGCGYTDGCNTLFQGLAADGMKRAMWLVTRECFGRTGPLAGSRPVVCVHDELILETPDALVSPAANRLSELMIQGMSEVIPDVPITTSFAAAKRWFKGAKARFNAANELVPWEPKAKAA